MTYSDDSNAVRKICLHPEIKVIYNCAFLYTVSRMNKYIHPRNIYKKQPDFKELRLEYPEFRDISTVVRFA